MLVFSIPANHCIFQNVCVYMCIHMLYFALAPWASKQPQKHGSSGEHMGTMRINLSPTLDVAVLITNSTLMFFVALCNLHRAIEN